MRMKDICVISRWVVKDSHTQTQSQQNNGTYTQRVYNDQVQPIQNHLLYYLHGDVYSILVGKRCIVWYFGRFLLISFGCSARWLHAYPNYHTCSCSSRAHDELYVLRNVWDHDAFCCERDCLPSISSCKFSHQRLLHFHLDWIFIHFHFLFESKRKIP